MHNEKKLMTKPDTDPTDDANPNRPPRVRKEDSQPSPQRSTRLAVARWIARSLLSIRYRITISGQDMIPTTGPALLVSNHVSWIDWLLIMCACPRPVHFIIHRHHYQHWYWRWLLDRAGVIPIDRRSIRQALTTAVDRLKTGHVVGIFPEGTISPDGSLGDFQPGFERIASQAGLRCVLPIAIDGMNGSAFSKRPLPVETNERRALSIRIGCPLPRATPHELRAHIAHLLTPSACALAMTHRLTQRLADLMQSDTTIGVILYLLGPPLMLIDIYGGGFVLTIGLVLIIVDRLKDRPPSSDRPS